MWCRPRVNAGGIARTTWNLDDDTPVVGTHYPSSTTQFALWFAEETRAVAYLEAVRFRNGLACFHCGVIGPHRGRDGAFWCGSCRHRFSVTSGTLLERTHIPVRTWLTAAWQLTNTKSGVSAVSLARALDIDYETAWYLSHKLRAAMSFSGHDRLRGDVELDETFVGSFAEGPGSGGAHAHDSNKTTVIVAAERGTATAIGRIRMARSYDSTVLCLARFIAENIEPGAVLLTDGWPSYGPALELLALDGLRYGHRPVEMGSVSGHPYDHLFAVHRAASLLKRWLLGTHHGSVSAHQMDQYLAEFVFRFNRRRSAHRGLLFWRLVCALVDAGPVRRDEIATRRSDMAEADCKLAREIEQHIKGGSRRYRARKATRIAKGIPVF